MKLTRTSARAQQAGFSLIELLIALSMLTIGLAGIAIIVTSAIVTDYRNRNDTTATMLAQRVLARIAAAGVNGTSPTITDCASTTVTIATTAGGANLASSASSPGLIADIDWTNQAYSAVPANYKMQYQTCSGQQYEIRWNINAINGYANQVSVGARAVQAATANASVAQLQYGTPVTLRTIVGQ